MDNQTIIWIVVGVAVLLVIIAIIYAVTRNNDDDTARRRPMQRRSTVARDVDNDRRPGTSRGDGLHDDDRVRNVDPDRVREVDPEQRRRGRRGGREPRA